MIFAAGLGTRLKPLTDTLPKALVPVAGRPLIDHVLSKLDSCVGAADGKPLFDGYVVNVHHFADMIEEWLAGAGRLPEKMNTVVSEEDASRCGGLKPEVVVSDERTRLLETGGGILHARPWLEGCGSFLIHNVDILSNVDISWFASQMHPDSLATLLVSERKTSRYLLFDPQSMRLVGWTNVTTGEVRSPYPDLDVASCRKLAFSGIHIMSDRVFDVMMSYVDDCGLSLDGPEGLRFPIMDFYLSVCSKYDIYGVFKEDLDLVDVGKLDSLDAAERFVCGL